MADQYQVAISFAGEQRAYAQEIVRHLQSFGVAVFYDEFERANLWGKDLSEVLYDTYARQTSYVLMLISSAYVEKKWCRHERRAAMSRALEERDEYILPVKFDNSWPDGVPETLAYIAASSSSPEAIAREVCKKLKIDLRPVKLSSIPPPKSSALVGEIAFNHTDHDGIYVIGDGVQEFDTKWSPGGKGMAHVYNDPHSISGVAINNKSKSFEQLTDVSQSNFTSRARLVKHGEFVIYRNKSGFYAVLKIQEILDERSGDDRYQIRLFYVIGDSETTDFSKYSILE